MHTTVGLPGRGMIKLEFPWRGMKLWQTTPSRTVEVVWFAMAGVPFYKHCMLPAYRVEFLFKPAFPY